MRLPCLVACRQMHTSRRSGRRHWMEVSTPPYFCTHTRCRFVSITPHTPLQCTRSSRFAPQPLLRIYEPSVRLVLLLRHDILALAEIAMLFLDRLLLPDIVMPFHSLYIARKQIWESKISHARFYLKTIGDVQKNTLHSVIKTGGQS